jgi:lactate permease
MALDFFLSWTPILLIMVLAVGLKRQALELACWGTFYTVGLVWFWFKTPLSVVALAALDGVLTNLPLLLVIYCGLLLSGLLLETGSLARVVAWFSSLTRDRWHSTLLIAVGSGNFMEGAGIVAEPIIAPMLSATGLPGTGAAALAIAGYAGLMTLELGGAILAVLALVTGLDVTRLGQDVALLSLPATILMVLSIPWLLAQGGELRHRWGLLLTVGVLAGGGALFAAHYVGGSVAGLFGGLVVLAGLGLAGSRRLHLDGQLLRDMAPLLLLVVCLFAVNLSVPLKRLAIQAWPAAVSIVPGHEIHFQPLFSAYTYIFLAYLCALRLASDASRAWSNFRATNRRAWRPVLAMALFGAAGQIIGYSGYETGFTALDPSRNIALTLANGVVDLSGRFYPVFAPLIGWAGTFLTGYGTASIVLFGKLHVTTAGLLGVSPTLLASKLAVGSSVGSISSPLKIALAAPMCGAQGREGEILQRTIPLGIGVSLLLGVVVFVLLG